MKNHFVWTDLSTFDLKSAKKFYKHCFNWQYQYLTYEYVLCTVNKQSSAGLYTMPNKFQKIGMPSFWMSYIHVENVQETARLAEKYGGKVEVMPEPASGGGFISLIRDPAGAGFTCYEGDDLNGRDQGQTAGRMVWNELHVSSLAKVSDFYTTLFKWQIQTTKLQDRFEIIDESKQIVGAIQVASNEVRDDKEYWGVYFAVNNLSKISASIKSAGGTVFAEQVVAGRKILSAYDPQGAFFYVCEISKTKI